MNNFQQNFDRLLSAWRRHEEARASGASISELAACKWELDAARIDTALSRPGWR